MIEIKKGDNNTFHFQLKSAEGQTLLKSIDFESQEDIKSTVEQLTPLAHSHGTIERRTNYDGNFLFDLKDKDGKVIGKSLLYDSEAGMENGITRFRDRMATLFKQD